MAVEEEAVLSSEKKSKFGKNSGLSLRNRRSDRPNGKIKNQR